MPLYHAQYADEGMNKLYEDCAADSLCHASFPKFKEEFKSLVDEGRRHPFGYKLKVANGETKTLSIPLNAFITKIRGLIRSRD
jgi:hypothetical protein